MQIYTDEDGALKMYMEEYKRWLNYNLADNDLKDELLQIKDSDDDIKDRFAAELSFGTAGLRGVLGAGTNRMNIYMVRKATQGLANYIISQKSAADASVAISFDSRIKSDVFAKQAACVLAANGISVHIYKELMPVPALSFATRQLKCDAGIMVTASHNPAKYNGYKAYGPDGCQMTEQAADAVYAEMQKTDVFEDVKIIDFDEALIKGLISYITDDVTEEFYKNILSQSVRKNVCEKADLNVVYSPLNGAGNVPVRHILNKIGVKNVSVVAQQEHPDGNFPTCPYPNPEIREALALGLAQAEKNSADLMLATDPDADRVGVALPDEGGEYKILTGNEIGVLLLDYICAARIESGTMPKNPISVSSVVSTDLAKEIAQHYAVEHVSVLTGFKYIGEQILNLEQNGEEDRFIFGFEESYGYLAGTYVRDKDAVVASMLICEMASYYKTNGSSLLKRLLELYKQYGYYLNKVDSFEFEGLSGMQTMQGIMDKFRSEPPKEIAGLSVLKIEDYLASTITNTKENSQTPITLPKANMLIYRLSGKASAIVRPSGTEPKIKIYYSTMADSAQSAEELRGKIAAAIKPLVSAQ